MILIIREKSFRKSVCSILQNINVNNKFKLKITKDTK